MNKFFKQLSLLFIKGVYKAKSKKLPQGLLVLQVNKPRWFYYPTNFANALGELTGRKIYQEEISHFYLSFNEEQKFPAWCYFDKEFLFFAPMGDNKIFLTFKDYYHHFQSNKGKFVIEEDCDDKKLQRQLFLEYRIEHNGQPIPRETLVFNLRSNETVHLASYHGEPLIEIMTDIKNWKSKNYKVSPLTLVN